MPTFRCDFQISSDLVLAPASEELAFESAGVAFKLRNDAPDEQGHARGLVAVVVGQADSLDEAPATLRGALARHLDLVAFVTQSRFKIMHAIRVITWEAGAGKRQLKVFHKFDARYPPDPEFAADYLATIAEFERVGIPEFARVALRHFRMGLLDELPEDQFFRIWSGLEIVAENVKARDKVAVTCAECGEPWQCSCGAKPVRVPFAKQAIENLINQVAGPAVAKRLFLARHGIAHGRTPESIERESGVSMSDLVNELGAITWEAIISTVPIAVDGPKLAFAHREGEFAYKAMVFAPVLEIDHNGPDPHPSDKNLPSVKLEVLTTFRGPRR